MKEKAKLYLKDRTFTKARHLAKHLGTSPQKAGHILRQLGWEHWSNTNNPAGKTWVGPNYEEI